MEHYAGIDVSLELSSVCVVDGQGKIMKEAKVASEPEALVCFFKELGFPMKRIGLEAGPLSQWLHAGLAQAGFETVLLETRHVKAALSAMTVKTDHKESHKSSSSSSKFPAALRRKARSAVIAKPSPHTLSMSCARVKTRPGEEARVARISNSTSPSSGSHDRNRTAAGTSLRSMARTGWSRSRSPPTTLSSRKRGRNAASLACARIFVSGLIQSSLSMRRFIALMRLWTSWSAASPSRDPLPASEWWSPSSKA